MNAFERHIDTILDDPLAPARRAGAAIGIVGTDIPEDLLAASGRHFAHLPWQAGRPTPWADRWLESSFPHQARSILEDWSQGRFDFLEAVVFTRGEDSVQRLYYYVCELQRTGRLGGPEPLILDVAKIRRPTSAGHTLAAVRRLAERLAVTEAALRAGIERTNARRAFFARLQAGREAGGSLYDRVAMASLFAPVEAEAAAFEAPRGTPRGRLVVAGSAPPDERLHRAVESAGWSVVLELYDRSLLRLGDPLDGQAEDPFAEVARRAHEGGLGSRSFVDRAAWLVAHARAARADAVLLWLVEEEEALVWHVPAQRDALAAAGIPALVLAPRRWDFGDGADEAIVRFLEEQGR